jgi:sarcosine oxidase subunit alpha
MPGAHHDMCKRTPVHDRSRPPPGAFSVASGSGRRARYFSADLDCREEIRNVRNNVGLLDASTLGKFRIHGPDALKALQRVYVSDMGALKEGRIKYSAMCNDDGCVIDDGVVIKTGRQRLLLHHVQRPRRANHGMDSLPHPL